MGDELRDDYTFDYSQAKPNRFAQASHASVPIATPEHEAGGLHTQLTDEQKLKLEDLYARSALSVDDLPYTGEMDQIHRAFVQETGLALTIRDVFKALMNLRRQGRLGRKFRPTPPVPQN